MPWGQTRAGGELGHETLAGAPGEKGAGNRNPSVRVDSGVVVNGPFLAALGKPVDPIDALGRNGSIMLGSVVPAGLASWASDPGSRTGPGPVKCSAIITFFLKLLIILNKGPCICILNWALQSSGLRVG